MYTSLANVEYYLSMFHRSSFNRLCPDCKNLKTLLDRWTAIFGTRSLIMCFDWCSRALSNQAVANFPGVFDIQWQKRPQHLNNIIFIHVKTSIEPSCPMDRGTVILEGQLPSSSSLQWPFTQTEQVDTKHSVKMQHTAEKSQEVLSLSRAAVVCMIK